MRGTSKLCIKVTVVLQCKMRLQGARSGKTGGGRRARLQGARSGKTGGGRRARLQGTRSGRKRGGPRDGERERKRRD